MCAWLYVVKVDNVCGRSKGFGQQINLTKLSVPMLLDAVVTGGNVENKSPPTSFMSSKKDYCFRLGAYSLLLYASVAKGGMPYIKDM